MTDFAFNPMTETLQQGREVIRQCYHPYHNIKLDYGGRWEYARVFHSTKDRIKAIEIRALIERLIVLATRAKMDIIITQQDGDETMLEYLRNKVKEFDARR